ncbi:MAG: AtpZ/AtpI family protein [Pseudomonadota bacterium]
MSEETEQKAASLETLTKRLDEVKKLQPAATPEAKLPGDAARAAIDFASATAVGTLLGYGLDAWQNTSPWGLLGGLLLGTVTGAYMMFLGEAHRRRSAETDKTE